MLGNPVRGANEPAARSRLLMGALWKLALNGSYTETVTIATIALRREGMRAASRERRGHP